MMRNIVWTWFRNKLQEGIVLPWWALIVRAILFPLDFFYWRMSKAQGYQFESDTWLIEGVRYSGEMMRDIARADGQLFRIVSRTGETVTIERVHNS